VPDYACQHNVTIGAAARFMDLAQRTGYVRGVRTKNWANTQLYCEQLEKGKRAIESGKNCHPCAGPAKLPPSVCA